MKNTILLALYFGICTTAAFANDGITNYIDIASPGGATILEAEAIERLGIHISDDFILNRHSDFTRLNEFEQRKAKATYLETITADLDARRKIARSNPAYLFSGSLTIGEYDFSRNVFPFKRFYKSMSGPGGRVSIERGSITTDSWNYSPTRGIDPNATPLGYFFDHRRHNVEYRFDWHPVFTSYRLENAEEAEEFLNQFGRRMNAVLITSLKSVTQQQGGRSPEVIYSFQVDCFLITSIKDNQFFVRSFSTGSEIPERCDNYVNLRMHGFNPTDYFDEMIEEAKPGSSQ